MEIRPIIKVGCWVVLTEDGLWAMDSYTFKTKKDAIWEVASATLDPRPTPKVKRLSEGNYLYYPKDIDYGSYGNCYSIVKVSNKNVDDLNERLKQQWDDDPLSEYD